jgi:hypothetical protein
MSYEFDEYLQAFDEGVVADDLTTDQNPYPDCTAMQLGWWHGKLLALTYAADFTSEWMADIAKTSAWYWKAHAQGLAAHQCKGNLLANPFSPKGWDNFQCPEKGDRVSWNGWAAGWRFGTLLNLPTEPMR